MIKPEDSSSDKDTEKEPEIRADKPFQKSKIVKDLLPAEIRWHYKNPGDKYWKPFSGNDSRLIEAKWREVNQYNLFEVEPPLLAKVKQYPRPVVLEDMYEVDFSTMKATASYWISAEPLSVLRATWFAGSNWQPLELEDSEKIEKEHMKIFKGQNQSENAPKRKILHTLKTKDFTIHWVSATEKTLTTHSVAVRISRLMKLKSQSTKLHRGYYAEAQIDITPPVRHLVFVIHGVGQKHGGDIVKCVQNMQIISNSLWKKYYKTANYRIIMLPVDWRCNLKLDGDTIESITPKDVPELRKTVNLTLLDVLYYKSPTYRNELMENLVCSINDLYTKFIINNPDFLSSNGKVSMIGHSLGSVLIYDAIMDWNPAQSYDDGFLERLEAVFEQKSTHEDRAAELINQVRDAKNKLRKFEKKARKMTAVKLNFNVANLFTLGSPLGVFLALRGFKNSDKLSETGTFIYNIYHPCDIVAYRCEPLLEKQYSQVAPLQIKAYDDPDACNSLETTFTVDPLATVVDDIDDILLDEPEIALQTPKSAVRRRGSVSFVNTKDTESKTSQVSTISGKQNSDPPQPIEAPKQLQKRKSIADLFKRSKKKLAASPPPAEKTEPLILQRKESKSSTQTGSTDSSSRKSFFRSRSKSISNPGSRASSVSLRRRRSSGQIQATKMFPILSSDIAEEKRIRERVDYTLRRGKMEVVDQITAFTSHVTYWTHQDCIMFMLNKIYKNIGGINAAQT